ncbi:MAG: InlB B-repeat-containing protein, partial [Clostridia bacterium]|nr:InlB B-repeat-containing protein [Clostridia bacterium]
TAVFGDESYSEDKVVTDEDTALGHSYGSPVFTWTETSDGYSATAEFTCARNADHKKTVAADVVAVTTNPTCEDDGYITYTATVLFGDEIYGDEKIVVNEDTALGHEYGEPVFVWTATADGYTATAEFTCTRNADHKETVTAEVVAVTTNPTCEDDGYITYKATAVFGNENYYGEKIVVNEKTALGHEYGSPVFVWTATADGYTAKAEFTCTRNADHKETVTAEVVAVTTDPTCEDDGYITYTATAVFGEESYSEDKVVTDEDTALGHEYGEPVFVWTETENGYTATAEFTCTRNAAHKKTVTAEVVAVTTDPTCEEDGYITYTATAVLGNENYSDKKVVVDEETALGHDFSQYYEGSNYQPTFVWTENADGSYTAKAVFYCKNDSSHTEEIDAEIGVEDGVDCTEGGNMYYYASVEFNDCYYTDEKVVPVEPGHDLIPVFHWITNADGYAVEFYMVCTREDYQDGPISVELTTSEGDDYVLYTATVVYNEKEYTESKKVVKTEKPLEVGETYTVGDTMIIDGNVYFSDDYERASRTSMTGNTPLVDVGYLEGTTQTDSFDAIIIENDQFVRVDDNGWAAGETPEWLFTPSDKSIVGVKVESGSGTDTDPYVLQPVYGVKVIFEANDGVFNTTEGNSVTQYYTEQEIEDGVYAIPPAENPESSGKLFLGWFTDEYATEKFDFEKTPITESITLYAGWIGI